MNPNRNTLRRLSAALLSSALLGAALPAMAAGVQVQDAWSRGTAAGQQAGGAFLTVKNTGATADRLVGASTPVADHVEVHTMSMEGDVMKMREVGGVDLPPGASVALEPGKLHLMLLGLKAPLQAGSSFPLTLRFEKAGEQQVEVKVQGR